MIYFYLKFIDFFQVPVVFGANVTISFDVTFGEDVTSTTAASAVLLLKKEILGAYQ